MTFWSTFEHVKSDFLIISWSPQTCRKFVKRSRFPWIPDQVFWMFCIFQPREVKYIPLHDGRKLCLECLDSTIMDTKECQPLYRDIQEFYDGLNMKVEQEVPLLLVERQALNEAREGEKHVTKNPFSFPIFLTLRYI